MSILPRNCVKYKNENSVKNTNYKMTPNQHIVKKFKDSHTMLLSLPGVTYPGAAALTKAPLARAALPLPLAT